MKGGELVDMREGIHNSVVLRQDYLMSQHLVKEVNAMLLIAYERAGTGGWVQTIS